VTGIESLGCGIDEAEVDDFDAWSFTLRADLLEVAFKPGFESFELRPVCIQTDTEDSDACFSHGWLAGCF
jgi:hypothetical protein